MTDPHNCRCGGQPPKPPLTVGKAFEWGGFAIMLVITVAIVVAAIVGLLT